MNTINNFIETLALLPADRIVVPKSGLNVIQHHAIYLGQDYYGHWFIENKEGFGVRKISAYELFKDVSRVNKIVKFKPKPNYSRMDAITYAIQKIGMGYDLLKYNCEHFANEIQELSPKSDQSRTAMNIAAVVGIAFLIIAINNN